MGKVRKTLSRHVKSSKGRTLESGVEHKAKHGLIGKAEDKISVPKRNSFRKQLTKSLSISWAIRSNFRVF